MTARLFAFVDSRYCNVFGTKLVCSGVRRTIFFAIRTPGLPAWVKTVGTLLRARIGATATADPLSLGPKTTVYFPTAWLARLAAVDGEPVESSNVIDSDEWVRSWEEL